MSTLRTEYEFVLPRGYLDADGNLHRRGIMRLATARDELEPLRDPTITSAEDPRLTVLVLARVVKRLGTLELVTPHEIEGLFAADLAYLQDFYGVINFGAPAEIDALLAAQAEMSRPAPATNSGASPAGATSAPVASGGAAVQELEAQNGDDPHGRSTVNLSTVPGRRGLIEEVPTATK
jgi:hypothetical protein